MKKIGRWLLALILTVMCICAVTACGSNKEGVYKFDSMTAEVLGKTVELKAGDKYMELYTLSEDIIQIELKSDGSYTISTVGSLFSAQAGTWAVNEKDSKKIDLTSGNVTTTVECDGKTIHMEQGGMQITLKK